jgi:hypothetical protein
VRRVLLAWALALRAAKKEGEMEVVVMVGMRAMRVKIRPTRRMT